VEFRPVLHSGVESSFRGIRSHYHDANFFVGNGRDKSLDSISPMDLHEFGPWAHKIVATRCVPKTPQLVCIGPTPTTHAGTASVRADDPACFHQAAAGLHTVLRNSRYWRVPKKIDAAFFGTPDHLFVEYGAPNPEPAAFREIRSNLIGRLQESNSSEGIATKIIQRNAQVAQSRLSFRQEAFAAGLINWRFRTVRNNGAQTFLSRGNGRGQARRTAPNYKDISVLAETNHPSHLPEASVASRSNCVKENAQILAARRANESASLQNAGEESATATTSRMAKTNSSNRASLITSGGAAFNTMKLCHRSG
jgi:hypothetical protein